MPNRQLPTLTIEKRDSPTVCVAGRWQVHALTRPGVAKDIKTTLSGLPKDASLHWDLSHIAALDHIGAQWLWNTWGRKRPQRLALPQRYEQFFKRLEKTGTLTLPKKTTQPWYAPASLARMMNIFAEHVLSFIGLIGQLALDLGRFAARPQRGPWKEISANIFHIGYQALGITALVGFLIGVVLSYLSAQQLHTFGGDIYLVNILGMSIIRELGPLLAAILVAGRSGSAITAQLGVMRVTEELDAMLVMGMPHGFRLIMPKVIALAISMPLLVVWTDVVALIGGMFAAQAELSLSPTYFLQSLPDAVPLANYWIGIGKGVVFGCLIALVACHFGLRIEPNTESLGQGTTLSVVTAITIVILADAVFAIVFKGVGFY
ncbi:ABC transporter permease [Noviherbaspirillum cavernae]|uniref:ABC transporter permease n=1 Tax=Noviherbaspirillum cavernae TaxID=2320862 RepID=A0A418WXC6_9BURK|nr:ABC transporter permease [Noviherbaspirillum cavernae]RJG04876.1 ABC transporter permease [Noviherbaspirillum cavernae]